jgi:hypothetical protein
MRTGDASLVNALHTGTTVVMRAPGDRRAEVRFEVFGAFWGTFEACEPVRLHDLTPQGALIEAHQPFAVESIQSVRLVFDGQPATAHACVRHLRPATNHDGYLVGVEFLSTSTAFLDAVECLITFRALPTELA